MKQNLICHIFSLSIIVILFGCDTLDSTTGLNAIGRPLKYEGEDGVIESINKVAIISPTLKDHVAGQHGSMYGITYKTYTLNNYLIQPIEAFANRDIICAVVVVKNISPSQKKILLDKATFMPIEKSKFKNSKEKLFKPIISVVYYDDGNSSIMTIPRDSPEHTPYTPTKRTTFNPMLGTVLYEFKAVDKVVRGDVSTIDLLPGSSAYIRLWFPVGDVEEGILGLTLSKGESIHIAFKELGQLDLMDRTDFVYE